MLFSSTWKITLAGTLLLDFGDYLEAEPDLAPSWVVQVVTPIRASASKRFPRGNASHTLSFTKIKPYPTHAEAQLAKVALLADLPRVTGDCSMEFLGGVGTATLQNACLAPSAGAARVDGHLLRITFAITGGALLAIPVADGDQAQVLDGDNTPIF